jgi:N-acetylglucosaminyldiphosphoundecaprenol N-acetyl-beta-D-mannosaminyltransferase
MKIPFININFDKKNILDFLFFVVPWLLIWGAYNTYLFKIFEPGFPRNALDLIHGLRAFLPFFSILLAVIFLVRKKHNFPENFLLTPLGLLGIYAGIGIISSIFSKSPWEALYWGILYASPIIIFLAVLASSDSFKKISLIININWVIAGVLSVLLVVIFLMQPGVISSLTTNFLICQSRPFEGIAGIITAAPSLDVFGTRPTGLGRYAGVAAIFAFAYLLGSQKGKKYFIWLLSFLVFFLILLFSKGRSELAAFIIAMVVVLWMYKKFKTYWMIFLFLAILLTISVTFYNIPCQNGFGWVSSFPQFSILRNHSYVGYPGYLPTPAELEKIPPGVKNVGTILTLSRRVTGAWKDAYKLFLGSPLVGYGFQADRYFLAGQHAHNTLVQALLQTGLLGTIFLVLAFILSFIYLYKAVMKKGIGGKEKYFLLGLIGVFVFFAARSLTESSGAYFDADWLFLAPIIAYASLGKGLLGRGDISGKSETSDKNKFLKFRGNKINIISLEESVKEISGWIRQANSKMHWIAVTGMHGVVEAWRDKEFSRILNSADLFLPDGISLILIARLKGFSPPERIGGADLMLHFFKIAEKEGFKSYFYGDTEDTLCKLKEKLLIDFPNLKIAGSYSPPFRDLTKEEDEKIIEKIKQTKPDILWVGLGLPKQEKWIFEHKDKLNIPVAVGVGASFKFLSGKVKRVPKLFGDAGFEWLWRLFHEPKIIWRRVFIYGPIFLWLAIADLTGFNNYKEK